jgi:hypothetical protein
MCTSLGRFSRDGDFNSRRGLYIKEVQPQDDAWSIKFSKTCRYRVPSTLATATIFVAAQLTGTSPERIMDGCCHKTSFKQGRKCRPLRGLCRSSKDLNRRSCHDYPASRGD